MSFLNLFRLDGRAAALRPARALRLLLLALALLWQSQALLRHELEHRTRDVQGAVHAVCVQCAGFAGMDSALAVPSWRCEVAAAQPVWHAQLPAPFGSIARVAHRARGPPVAAPASIG